jgi:heme exporter protein A
LTFTPVSGDMQTMNIATPPDAAITSFVPVTLTATGLCLSRGGLVLVENFTLNLSPGDALLLTGANGAGKTTLLRALAGFIQPDAGTVSVNDAPVLKTANEHIAWLGHTDGLKPSETVRQSLQFWCDVSGLSRLAIMPALRALHMDRYIDRPTGRLSRGQQRRVALARVALSQRSVWLLDEPAGPLDAKGRDRLAGLVEQHRSAGGIVIAATHQLLDWPDARTQVIGAGI